MSIYTKTGDKGKTALFGGKRVWKYDPQVEAYGVTDEATCFIGLAIESIPDLENKRILTDVQLNLYSIMAYLSNAPLQDEELIKQIKNMERIIDDLDKNLPKLTRFILPQGSEITVRLHVARAKVRSAERRIVEFIAQKDSKLEQDNMILQYINRLSDFLFMLARKYSSEEKQT